MTEVEKSVDLFGAADLVGGLHGLSTHMVGQKWVDNTLDLPKLDTLLRGDLEIQYFLDPYQNRLFLKLWVVMKSG